MYIFYIITLLLYFFFHHLYHWCCVCLHLPCMFKYSNLFIYSYLFIVYSVNNHYVVLYKCTKIKIYIYSQLPKKKKKNALPLPGGECPPPPPNVPKLCGSGGEHIINSIEDRTLQFCTLVDHIYVLYIYVYFLNQFFFSVRVFMW